MILLDGKSLANDILSNLKFKDSRLDIILIGDDPASLKYTSLKQQKAQQLNIDCQLHHLPLNTPSAKIIKLIQSLNTDPAVTGFFIQLPLADKTLLSLISPTKDVDGLNPNSNFTPAVVLGIVKLFDHYQLPFASQNIVIINDSDLIGQPLKKYFETQNAFVTLCNNQTQSLSAITQEADILISATGVKNLISADMVKPGVVVVDVANGDVDFTSVAPKASYITPTFGGIGPMTIACLFWNLSQVST